jgi:hypothetical protein
MIIPKIKKSIVIAQPNPETFVLNNPETGVYLECDEHQYFIVEQMDGPKDAEAIALNFLKKFGQVGHTLIADLVRKLHRGDFFESKTQLIEIETPEQVYIKTIKRGLRKFIFFVPTPFLKWLTIALGRTLFPWAYHPTIFYPALILGFLGSVLLLTNGLPSHLSVFSLNSSYPLGIGSLFIMTFLAANFRVLSHAFCLTALKRTLLRMGL